VIRVEASRVIARPIEAGWGYIADLDNMPTWDPGLARVRWQAPLRQGARIELHDTSPVLRLVSRIVPPVFTVTDYEGGRRFAFGISRGASSIETVYSLESTSPATTRVTRTFTFDGHGIWRLLELATQRRAIRHREAEVENLKRLLEGSGPTAIE
jgi:uncharacterized protein YndB with AHSA1/START domain